MQTPTGTLIVLGAALLAGPALAQSAQVNSSGAVIAAERTAPGPDRATSISRGETPADETASDNGTGVRAPAVTYLYESSNRDHIDQDAQADIRKDPSSARAPGSSSGENQQGELRIINNSESETAQVEGQYRVGQSETPVNGIGGTGGGRYTFTPTQRSTPAPTPSSTPGSTGDADPIFDRWGQRRVPDNASEGPERTSNRDHIDQDAQADQRRRPSRDQAPGSTSGARALTEVSGSQGADFRSGSGGMAPANVSVVRNSCVAPNTVELVTLSGSNTLEYTFQRLPNGPSVVFAGIVNSTPLNNPRRLVLPNGTYRLTFRHPGTAPIGVWPQDVVIRPHHMVGGTCVPIDPRTRPGLPTSPVQ